LFLSICSFIYYFYFYFLFTINHLSIYYLYSNIFYSLSISIILYPISDDLLFRYS